MTVRSNTEPHRVVLSLNIANELIKRGFQVVQLKPSTSKRGHAAFLFDNTHDFEKVFNQLLEKRQYK